tara:strand:- start:94 stop:738 length:645 start_codon:yes stop_codon:yes gene_type:complete
MSQHDYNLANASGANFRTDLNAVLDAILTNNASTVAPTTTGQYMFWADSSATVMKARNHGDTAFINVFKFTPSTIMPYIQTSAGAQAIGSALVQRTVNNAFTKSQRAVPSSVSYSSTVTLLLNDANNFNLSALTGNLTMANPPASTLAGSVGQSGSVRFIQDGTGSRTVSFASAWKFPAGTAPTASTASGTVDRADYKILDVSTIDANFVNNVS